MLHLHNIPRCGGTSIASNAADQTLAVSVGWWQRRLGYVFTPGITGIEKWKADREALEAAQAP
jgi:hypothetical protein